MRTEVCIIGAGPAGLLLGHLLRAEGIECVVLERRSPDYVLGRVRAGVLEDTTVSLMERLGLESRLKAEGLPHSGFNLSTRLMHGFPEDGPFERAMQVAELNYIASSRAAQTSIAECYVGLPV